MFLPTEILQAIFADLSEHHLPKPDLKSARLVCKAWAAQASPFLFTNVFITARYADLEVAESLASHFGQYIKTLTYSTEYFRQWANLENYARYVEESNPEHHNVVKRPACFDAHTRQNWETYNRLGKEKQEIGTEEQQILHLVRAFKTMPRISRVIYTHSWRRRAQCWCLQALTDARQRENNPWKSKRVCPTSNCKFPDYHQHRCVKSLPPCWSDRPTEAWKVLMHALNRSGKNIHEILIDNPDEEESSLPAEVFIPSSHNDFNPPFSFITTMKNLFASLTKLQLSLSVMRPAPHFDYVGKDVRLSQILETAINLSSLRISLLDETWCELDADVEEPLLTMFAGCSFPKLASLDLNGCGSTATQLLLFLKESPDLHELSLRRYALTDGFWRPVVQELRDNSRVRTLNLNELHGGMENGNLIGFEDCYFDVEAYEIDHIVEGFFYREKGSQFSKEELELILEEGEMRSRSDSPSDESDLDVSEGDVSESESQIVLYENPDWAWRFGDEDEDEYESWSE